MTIQELNLRYLLCKFFTFVRIFEPAKALTVYLVINKARNAAFGNFLSAAHVPTTAGLIFGALAAFVAFLQGDMALMPVAALLVAVRVQFNRLATKTEDHSYLRLLSLNRDFMEERNQFMNVRRPSMRLLVASSFLLSFSSRLKSSRGFKRPSSSS